MNRAARRRIKQGTEPVKIETAQHKRFIKMLPFLLGFMLLLLGVFVYASVYYGQFYHNELGQVKLVGSDGSLMYVEDDGTFRWYRAKWETDAIFDKDNDYLAGVMRFYTGDDAYKILDTYSEHFWNITSDTIGDMFDEEYKKEDMFIMIVKGVYFKEEGIETKLAKDNTDYVKYYLGFRYNDGKTLQLMEHDSASMFQFTVEDYDLNSQ